MFVMFGYLGGRDWGVEKSGFGNTWRGILVGILGIEALSVIC